MKTILVATDFSEASLNAANYAADIATVINADILLLHVYQISVTYAEVPLAVGINDQMKDVNIQINHLKESLLQRTGSKIKIDARVVENSFFQGLKKVCDDIQPYVVVMGSQGTTATERLFFGGHTVHTMRHLTWPLITVPVGSCFLKVNKIGLACDFNNVTDCIPIEEIKMFVSDLHAELHVLNIGKRTEFSSDNIHQLSILKRRISSLKPIFHFITSESIEDGIMDFAERNSIDLLIALPKHREFIQRLIYKSHTKHFILHSHVPVMALHEQVPQG